MVVIVLFGFMRRGTMDEGYNIHCGGIRDIGGGFLYLFGGIV